MRNKILSLLVLLLTVATGAWADILLTEKVWKPGDKFCIGQAWFINEANSSNKYRASGDEVTVPAIEYLTNEWHLSPFIPCIQVNYGTGTINMVSQGELGFALPADKTADDQPIGFRIKSGMGTQIVPYQFELVYESPVIVDWDVANGSGTFEMPASDVLLTPVFTEATIVSADGQTETPYEKLIQAFLAVQDGETIQLDWDVFINGSNPEDMNTMHRATAAPVKFTLDFNGHIIDGNGVDGPFIITNHAGDEITFIDSSNAQTGGFKGYVEGQSNSFIFTAGRYNYNDHNAAYYKENWAYLAEMGWVLADGKEFIDLEGGYDANDGFMVRVAHKAFELTIGAGKFATFYLDQNIKLDEATPADVKLYTISNVDADRTTATITQLTGIVAKETPMLVYNGTADEQTVKLKVTTDAANATNAKAIEQFKGTAEDREFTDADMQAADYYVLSGGKAFAKVRGAGTISANKCWLQFNNNASFARSINLVFEGSETTGISTTDDTDSTDKSFYDLQGRQVQKTTKGIYISNERKVVIK